MNALKKLVVEGVFLMREGVLRRPSIAYETLGRLNRGKDNAVLAFTGLSPSAHIASPPEGASCNAQSSG